MNSRTRSLSSLALFSALLSAACSSPKVAEAPQPVAPKTAVEKSAEAPTAVETERVIPIEKVVASGTFLAPLPTAVTSFGAAASDTSFYVLGGYSGTPHAYSKEGQSTDILQLETGSGKEWQRIGSLEKGLQGLFAVHYKDKLCHFGGNHASNEAGTPAVMNSVASARCIDLVTQTWTELPALPEGRSSHGGAIVGSRVFLAGGWTLKGGAHTGAFLDKVLSLDLSKAGAKWEVIEAPFKRRAVGVVSVGTKLVVVGGMEADQKISAKVDVYDTETKKWSKGAAHPGDAFGISVTSDGSAVFASGREGILRKWAPGEEKWTDVRNLAFARFFHETRPMGSELVFVGGIGGMHTRGRTAVVEKLPKDSSLTFGQMQFAYPGNAKNRQGILQNGEQLYLFGGNVSLEQHDFEVKHFSDEGWRLDLATLNFTSGPRFPLHRQSMQTLSTETGGFAFGGFGHEPQAGEKTEALSHPELFSFDWEKSSWAPVGALPRGRTQFGVVEGAGKIWILGGLNYDPSRKDSFQHDQSIWVAEKPKSDSDPLKFEVADIELPGPRRAFAGAALNGKYYLVGGMKEGFQLVDDCLEFDLESRKFSTIPCPAPRLSGDLVPAGGKLYLVGGSVKGAGGIEESRTVEVFDPAAKTWSKVDFEVPFSTRHLRALPYRDQILLETTHFEGAEMSVGVLSPGK